MKVFKEEQRFTQLWLHLIMALTTIGSIIILYKEWINNVDKSFSENKSYLIPIIIIIFTHLLIYKAKLSTKIDEIGIHYQFIPFQFSYRKISWENIEKIYIRNYSPILEYGGWGLRYTFNKKRGNAVNISGNIGIQIELKNGKRLLIGIQKKEDVKRILETYKSKIS